MRYLALATDYDGTLATDGRVPAETLDALQRLRHSGRKLLLVTGREIQDLMQVFPGYEVFDRIVGENGAVLYEPLTKRNRLLTEPASKALIERLQARKVDPLFVGQCIIATREPHQEEALSAIHELGLEHHVIFNKGAVMILPPEVSKATGLECALRELGISRLSVVGVGDAENDHALLNFSGCGVALQNALPTLKQHADFVTRGNESQGVMELIEAILKDDLASHEIEPQRHSVLLGKNPQGGQVHFNPPRSCILFAGPSGGGKSTCVTAILERVAEKGYQFCVMDPEGDFEKFPGAITLGDPQHRPSDSEVLDLLGHFENPAVNMLGIPLHDRPGCFASLLTKIQDLRSRTGHPPFIIIEEAHHLLPAAWKPALTQLPSIFEGLLMVTVNPGEMSDFALQKVDIVIALAKDSEKTLEAFAKSLGLKPPKAPKGLGDTKLDVVIWPVKRQISPFALRIEPGKVEHDRHRRKYATGDLREDAFFFRGPENRLNLKAQNLALFTQIAEGVDDGTWLFHLTRHDYSKWIRKAVQDDELAKQVAEIESSERDPGKSRARIKDLIEKTYTAAA